MATDHYLLSNASLQATLAHMQSHAISADPGQLADAWRAAQAMLQRLTDKEAGCADNAPILPLPAEMAAAANALQMSPQVNMAHRLVPVAFGLIEVDAMMSTQPLLRQARLNAEQCSLPATLDDPALAALCLAMPEPAATAPAVHWDGHQLQVLSDDDDVDVLHAAPAEAATACAVVAPGIVQGALQLAFGTPLPVMHAVHLEGRVLLVKGHHRARVLRAAGATFLPCLVSWCSSLDEVLAAAPSLQREEAARCFAADRPPMLRDFDRSALVHSYEAKARRHLLQVRIDVTRQWLP